MKISILLCIALVAFAQNAYAPAMNIMMRNVLVDKIREIVIPELMKQFSQVNLPEVGQSNWAYEAKIYDSHASYIPLTADQLLISVNPDKNSFTVTVKDFTMKFDSRAYARALFVSANGYSTVVSKMRTFSFSASP